jgi:hypothetical protein
VHVIAQQVQPALGLRARHAEAVGQQPAQVRRGGRAERERREPGRQDPAAVRDD